MAQTTEAVLRAEIQRLKAELEKVTAELRAVKEERKIDHLTRLYVRAQAEQNVTQLLCAERRTDASDAHALVLLDVDHFKRINDTYGHTAGDAVLRRVGAVLLANTRSSDLPFRYGGEEFGIVFRNINLNYIGAKVEYIREEIQSQRFEDYPGVHVTASFGISRIESLLSLTEVFNRADRALYESKNLGRNRVTLYNDM